MGQELKNQRPLNAKSILFATSAPSSVYSQQSQFHIQVELFLNSLRKSQNLRLS